jgi:hypothetical protein
VYPFNFKMWPCGFHFCNLKTVGDSLLLKTVQYITMDRSLQPYVEHSPWTQGHLIFYKEIKVGRTSLTAVLWISPTRRHPHTVVSPPTTGLLMPNSGTYNFVVDVFGHNLESSQTWGFFMDFLYHGEGGMDSYQGFPPFSFTVSSNWTSETIIGCVRLKK